MNFDWDESKRQQTIAKHGIDFADVPQMFDGPMLVCLDTRRSYSEDRWIGIGLLNVVVAVVVYVEWENEDTIRIISARRATRNESIQFQQRISD